MFHALHSIHMHGFWWDRLFLSSFVGQSGYMCVSVNNDFSVKKYVCMCRKVCMCVCLCEVDLCVKPLSGGLNYHTKLFYLHLLQLSCHSVWPTHLTFSFFLCPFSLTLSFSLSPWQCIFCDSIWVFISVASEGLLLLILGARDLNKLPNCKYLASVYHLIFHLKSYKLHRLTK